MFMLDLLISKNAPCSRVKKNKGVMLTKGAIYTHKQITTELVRGLTFLYLA